MPRFFPPKAVWLAFLLHSAVVVVAVVLAQYIPLQEPMGFIDPDLPSVPYWLEKFIRWDAHWYTYIAEHGYDSRTVVFFPALPVLMRLLSYLGLSSGVAGFAVCNLGAFMTFLLMHRLFRLDFPEPVVRRALLAYAVFPTSFFLNSVYTEALFLVASLACVYFARTGRWWWAGIFAAAATLTRNLGIGLLFLMLYEYRYGSRRRPDWFRPEVFAFALAPLALLAFMVYNYSLTGDPIGFVHSQRIWGRQFGLPWDNFVANIRLIFTPGWTVTPGVILDSVTVAAYLAGLAGLTFTARFGVRDSYLLLGWFWLMIPLFSMTPFFPLYSLSRFVLVIFPFYLLVAQLPQKVYRSYILICTVLLALCTALFVNWFWLG